MFHIEKCPLTTANNEKGIIDPFMERRLINIERMSFPLRETRKDTFTRLRHRTINNKTAREDVEEFRDSVERQEYLSIAPTTNSSATDNLANASADI